MNYLSFCLIIFFTFPAPLIFAEEKNQNKGFEAAQDFEGNKICPVYVGKEPTAEKFSYLYEEKTVYFCCSLCIEYFQKNPKHFMKKLEKIEKEEQINKNTIKGESNEYEK